MPHHLQQQQQQRRRKHNNDQANYHEYLDYSGYSPTEDSLYADMSGHLATTASPMYPLHQQSFMPKSHSFHNRTSFSSQLQPQFDYNQAPYRVNNNANGKQQGRISGGNVGFVFQAGQGQQQVSGGEVGKSSSKIRFDVNQLPFTPKGAVSGGAGGLQK